MDTHTHTSASLSPFPLSASYAYGTLLLPPCFCPHPCCVESRIQDIFASCCTARPISECKLLLLMGNCPPFPALSWEPSVPHSPPSRVPPLHSFPLPHLWSLHLLVQSYHARAPTPHPDEDTTPPGGVPKQMMPSLIYSPLSGRHARAPVMLTRLILLSPDP